MKRGLFALIVILLAAQAQAQPAWGYDNSWNQPHTKALQLVRDALDHGLCEQAAVDFIRAQGYPAVTVAAGQASPAGTITWYGKGSACEGKFQYVTVDGPYMGNGVPYSPGGPGWEVSWSSSSWIDDAAAPIPGFGNHHPTQWRIVAFGTLTSTDGSIPPQIQPVSVPTPTPAPAPAPAPTPAPAPAPTPAPQPILIDYSALLQQIIAQQARQIAIEQDTNTHVVTMDKTVGETLGQIGIFVSKYVAPAVAAWIAAKHIGG